MAGFFLLDDSLQLIRQISFAGFTPKCGFQVVLTKAEKAGADFAIGG